MLSRQDRAIMQDLARRYLEVCRSERNAVKRQLWFRHNSLHPTRPLFLAMTRQHFIEDTDASRTGCADPFLQLFERELKRRLYHAACDDDTVFEPWLVHHATHVPSSPGAGPWGVPFVHEQVPGGTGWHIKPTILEPEDLCRLVRPSHHIDEVVTAEGRDKLLDAVGDILPVVIDRGPMLRSFPGDIATDIGFLRGHEQMLWDLVDRPDWYHQLLALLRDGVQASHDACAAAGDWSRTCGDNQSMPYAEELPLPSASPDPVARRTLWWFMAAQEYASISPAMHDEFLLQYQLPILRQFGLVAYGCCEDLTRKIDILRKIPNLRRIAVTPWADVPACAEQIGHDYVCSWRPNPARMVCCGYDENQVRLEIAAGLDEFARHDCRVDITLKDVQTVEGHPERIRDWCRVVRWCVES